jgi:hypothetical protein
MTTEASLAKSPCFALLTKFALAQRIILLRANRRDRFVYYCLKGMHFARFDVGRAV